ncbi:MAG: DUF1697 domain-containing protein [Cellulomonas sp.]|nr:DUF1697 domain-containing protein [Cellulomonas sp.]
MTTTHVALLRAINVGGVTVPMTHLRDLATELGWTDIITYLATGNLLFATEESAATIEQRLAAALRAEYAREVPVVVRTPTQLAATLERVRPVFPNVEPKRVQIAFLNRDPGAGADERLGEFPPDEHLHLADALALHYPNGQARSTMTTSAIERRLGVVATVRGLATVEGILVRSGITV